MTHFQSYLFIGSKKDTQKEIIALAKKLQIDITLSSPDKIEIAPQNLSISINEIRALKSKIFQKPLKSKFHLAIISDAQKLTIPAQNALLKILEEPPQSAIIVLEAQEEQSIIETIKSRVLQKNIQPVKQEKTSHLLINDKSWKESLVQLAQITDPLPWLDGQITAHHFLLTKNIRANRPHLSAKISDTLEKCIEAKKMIKANVNPKFVLFNLALQLHSP